MLRAHAGRFTDRPPLQPDQDRYAADDLETMQEARLYTDHVFGLVRGFLGSRVLEVGRIGTMTRRLVDVADTVVGIEPNRNCAARSGGAMGAHPRFTLRACHFEECDAAELARQRFDSVVLVNVLEHIADDVCTPEGVRSASSPPADGDRLRARIADGVWSLSMPSSGIIAATEAHAPRGVSERGPRADSASLH